MLNSSTATCLIVYVRRHPSALATALLVFLAAAAGTWVIPSDAGSTSEWLRGHLVGGRGRRLCLEREVEILEQHLRPVVDSALGHLYPVAHQVHGHEITFEQLQQV